PNGKAQTDQSCMALTFAKKPVTHEVVSRPVLNSLFRIPAAADNHQVESWHTATDDCQIVGFMPHMHLRGKDFLYELVYPDGKKEILLSVPRYQFNWQSVYRPAESIPMPKGAKVHCVAHFDNSANNLNNPEPTRVEPCGDQT